MDTHSDLSTTSVSQERIRGTRTKLSITGLVISITSVTSASSIEICLINFPFRFQLHSVQTKGILLIMLMQWVEKIWENKRVDNEI